MIKIEKCNFSWHLYFTWDKNQMKRVPCHQHMSSRFHHRLGTFLMVWWELFEDVVFSLSQVVVGKIFSARFFFSARWKRRLFRPWISGKVDFQGENPKTGWWLQCRWRGEGSFVTFPYFWLLRYISSQFLNKCFTTIFLKLNSL